MINIRDITETISVGLLDLNAFSNEKAILVKRELEKAGSLFLLKHMLNTTAFAIHYSAQNKPFLKDRSEHISISHSHDKLAIIINKRENTGIDIELIRDKVVKVKHKFLNDLEIRFANNDIEKLITYWASKEALYKVYGLKELDFKANLFVEDFVGSDFFARIEMHDLKKRFRMRREAIDNYLLVYILNEV